MKTRNFEGKKPSCNNFNHLPIREAVLQRQLLMRTLFPQIDAEEWKPLPENRDYLLSNWGRVIHLKSYHGKQKMLTPTIRISKYPSITISTAQGKRKGISLLKFMELLFNNSNHA